MNQNQVEPVKAYLKEAITYRKDGVEVTVPKDGLILVDVERGIALVGDDHCDIHPNEYQVLTV